MNIASRIAAWSPYYASLKGDATTLFVQEVGFSATNWVDVVSGLVETHTTTTYNESGFVVRNKVAKNEESFNLTINGDSSTVEIVADWNYSTAFVYPKLLNKLDDNYSAYFDSQNNYLLKLKTYGDTTRPQASGVFGGLHYYAFTIGNQVAKIYVDGQLESSITIPVRGDRSGSYSYGTENDGNGYARFGQIRICNNQTLTAAEIAHNYAVDKARFGLT